MIPASDGCWWPASTRASRRNCRSGSSSTRRGCTPRGLRDGRIGLAPLAAVLSFLRQEGDDPYQRVAARAGAYSAEWLVDSLSPFRQRVVLWMPARLRVWLVLRLARRLVRQTYGGTRATIRDVRRERGALDLRGSVFCQVRTPGGLAAVPVLRRGRQRAVPAIQSVDDRRGRGMPRDRRHAVPDRLRRPRRNRRVKRGKLPRSATHGG